MRLTKAEIIEEILLNLPVKSLLRFSSVSKSWNSTIFGSDFRKRYRRRAGRERIVAIVSVPGVRLNTIIGNPSTCLLSSIQSSSNIVDATPFESPFGNNHPHMVLASCDDLWLARSYGLPYGLPLILWNPSTRSFKHVPDSTLSRGEFDVALGLGYECAGDDYKILRVTFKHNETGGELRARLYSLRFDCWREIEDCPTKVAGNIGGGCAFVSGKLHFRPDYRPFSLIKCFDLLTEKFGEVAPPVYSLESLNLKNVSVLKEMLCLSIDYDNRCDVWVMEEYGVAGSWTKKFSIAYFIDLLNGDFMMPLYLYDNGEILVRYFDGMKTRMFVYNEEDGRGRAREVFVHDNKTGFPNFVYVDSLVAPAMCDVDTRKDLSSNEHDHAQT